MKVKSSKKVKPENSKLHELKQSKNDIVKMKQKKTDGLAAASVTPHTFAEKKVQAVKKKNKTKSAESAKAKLQLVSKAEVVAQKKHDVKPDKSVKLKKGVANKVNATQKNKAANNTEPEHMLELQKENEVNETLVSQKVIKSALKACKKALDGGFDQKKNLFGEDLKYGLQIASLKIPDVPSRNCRVQLPNAIYQKGDDICLIVKDMERGRKHDHEDTQNFWTDKLRQLGVDYITQVIPFRQLKQDYREYEMKLKLVHRFDRFLVDARINGHVFNFLGNNFIRRCKNPTPVILEKDEKIVKSLNKALGRVTYKQTNTGRITEIQFATHKMPLDKAVENAESLLQAMKTQYPGGWQNMRTIYLKPMTDIQLTFPLYVNKADPNSVPVPKITGPRERFEKGMNEKLLAATNSKYKFQEGNLVRVAFEKRNTKKAKKVEEGSERKAEKGKKEVEDEQEDSDEEEMELERASDTEQSDLGDSDDDK
ncbi:ribosomal L1 domain-containing protein CG13096 [Armigeres subalbatus]|uniref:ribosomal L1 domain-containing protein CG13096 n=1 Tax=Armigeres subalbatus TaxID=124917 RepID=UPI002ED437C9